MKKVKKYVWASSFALSLMLMNTQPLLADVGNSGGFGGGSSSSSSGGFGDIFYLMFASPQLLIAILAIFAIKYFFFDSKKKTMKTASSFNTTNLDENGIIEQISKVDPNFSASKFKSFSGEVYMSLQNAWMKKEWSHIRPFESNTLFNMHNRQLQELVDKKQTNYLERQDVRKVTLAKYYQDGDQEVLEVRLNAALLDYTKDDISGKLIDGSETQIQERSYRLEFVRKVGVLTKSEDGISITNCPNCGAPNSITSSGECEYCHSLITNGDYGWVLNKYGAWN